MDRRLWRYYMGQCTTPEAYAAQGGNVRTIRRHLARLYGDPDTEGHLTRRQIRKVAKELANLLRNSTQ